jgi:hypothetical protein
VSVTARPPAAELLANPDAVLTRSDLAVLGYERRAVDAIFRAGPVEAWPGYSRPLIRVSDFLAWRDRCTYRGDRVRPAAGNPPPKAVEVGGGLPA